jgi:hypothetical protein
LIITMFVIRTLRQVEEFNRGSRYRKRGIAITPTKFGISFTTKFLNQVGVPCVTLCTYCFMLALYVYRLVPPYHGNSDLIHSLASYAWCQTPKTVHQPLFIAHAEVTCPACSMYT